mmetsp:Transcript_13285/g.46427  ORF Transcript_13285/g.46427 Transcript_13285/m.46427 type:complete len:113 (-) Transcript_13285:16-354(-)
MARDYGAMGEHDEVAEEMEAVTDDEAVKKKRSRKNKNGLKPGQALSFTGLEPRKWDGVDMLDMKQLLPRFLAGCLCMTLTIGLVTFFSYQVLEGPLGKALDASQNLKHSSGD